MIVRTYFAFPLENGEFDPTEVFDTLEEAEAWAADWLAEFGEEIGFEPVEVTVEIRRVRKLS